LAVVVVVDQNTGWGIVVVAGSFVVGNSVVVGNFAIEGIVEIG